MIAHRDEHAVLGAERRDGIGHISIEAGATRDEISRHHGQIRRLLVAERGPLERTRLGIEAAHVQVAQLRDPVAFEFGRQVGDSDVDLPHAHPAPLYPDRPCRQD